MKIILLSGGSGKRLWPLSNDVRSKQFIKLLNDECGMKQSMVQRVYGQIQKAMPDAEVIIATNSAQMDCIRSQLPEDIEIVIEPERRDTYPAIMLSCAYLAYEKHVPLDETVVVLPIDPYTDDEFFVKIAGLEAPIKRGSADIALIGIKPTLPTSKYGYILPEGNETPDGIRNVSRFIEKPDERNAAILIEHGALWNGGVFAFRLGFIIHILQKEIPYTDFSEMQDHFRLLEKISFDYQVVEKAERVAVKEYGGEWSDIGTWRTLTDRINYDAIGNVRSEKTRNTFIINELNIPVVALGVKNMVIAASPDGILVSDLVESSQLKPVVDRLDSTRPMYEDRRWGNYIVMEKNEKSLTKVLTITPEKEISYQRHLYRDEIWVITSGSGYFVLDDHEITVKAGDVLKIYSGQWHSIKANDELRIVEVQLGIAFDEEDIERKAYVWKQSKAGANQYA